MRNNFIYLVFISIGLTMVQCKPKTSVDVDPYESITDLQARDIVKKAIDLVGGIDAWKYTDTIEYMKQSTLYLENGDIESDTIVYNLVRLPEAELYVGISSDGTKLVKQDSAAYDMATYTMGMPYKLLDQGATLDYVGKQTIEGQELYAIEVHYDPSQYPNHRSQETWTYFFSTLDYSMNAAKVISSDHRNLILNRSFSDYKTLKLVHERQSYRIDDRDSILYLRANYIYNYQ